jgi:ABC-2 type transport system permease protein
MSKVWLIAGHHFRQETSKRSFLLVLFSLPLFLGLSVGVGYLSSRLAEKDVVLGYVDPVGLIVKMPTGSKASTVRLVPYETSAQARAALEAGEIAAYYVIGADGDQGRAELVYVEAPPYRAQRYFDDVVRLNWMADQPPALVERVLSGAQVTVQAVESRRTFPSGGPSAGQIVPVVGAVIFGFLVLTTSGYMMEAIVTEKENRTMEVIVTSVSPRQMMAGKILGALAIGVLQLAVWLAFFAAAAWVGREILDMPWLQEIRPNWRDLGMIVLVAAPSYLFIGALMTTVGTTLVESQEAQQAGPLLFLPILLPVYLLIPIARNLNGPLSLGLSFFPVTGVMTMAIRSVFMQVPAWQFIAAAVIALISGLGMVWLAGQAFRIGMLSYGRRLRLRDLLVQSGAAGSARDRVARGEGR